MYISMTLQYKLQEELQMHCSKELESVSIQLKFTKKKSFAIGKFANTLACKIMNLKLTFWKICPTKYNKKVE